MKRTTDAPETKLVPFTVNVKSASPTVLLVGEMLVVVGAGLFTVCGVPVEGLVLKLLSPA